MCPQNDDLYRRPYRYPDWDWNDDRDDWDEFPGTGFGPGYSPLFGPGFRPRPGYGPGFNPRFGPWFNPGRGYGPRPGYGPGTRPFCPYR